MPTAIDPADERPGTKPLCVKTCSAARRSRRLCRGVGSCWVRAVTDPKCRCSGC